MAAETARNYLRLHSDGLVKLFGGTRESSGTTEALRDTTQEIVIYLLPVFNIRTGASLEVAILLALLSLYFGDSFRLRSGVCVTGRLAYSGRILPVGDVTTKILGAARCGAELILVPDFEAEATRRALEHEPEVLSKVRFVGWITDVFRIAVKGGCKSLQLLSLQSVRVSIQFPSRTICPHVTRGGGVRLLNTAAVVCFFYLPCYPSLRAGCAA